MSLFDTMNEGLYIFCRYILDGMEMLLTWITGRGDPDDLELEEASEEDII
jgi:hypothetical protein